MSTKTSTYVTNYDLLKVLALVLMLVDHVGFYFFPDELWFRVIGRLCVPIWCFLIGYARSRDIGWPLWVGVLVVTMTNLITGGAIFPVTILATFLIIRLTIDWIARNIMISKESMITMAFVLTLIYWPSMMVVEYGAAAMVLALGGYSIREGNIWAKPIWIGAIILYFISQVVVFNFMAFQALALAIGLIPIGILLWRFAPMEFYGQKNKLLQFAGRNTLWIYVAHLVLFKLISAYFMLGGYAWFAPIKYW